jgi:hypothetical protein
VARGCSGRGLAALASRRAPLPRHCSRNVVSAAITHRWSSRRRAVRRAPRSDREQAQPANRWTRVARTATVDQFADSGGGSPRECRGAARRTRPDSVARAPRSTGAEGRDAEDVTDDCKCYRRSMLSFFALLSAVRDVTRRRQRLSIGLASVHRQGLRCSCRCRIPGPCALVTVDSTAYTRRASSRCEGRIYDDDSRQVANRNVRTVCAHLGRLQQQHR